MRLIEAESTKLNLIKFFYGKKSLGQVIDEQPTINAIVINDGMTNEDIINTLFPKTDFVTDVFGGFGFPEWWLNEKYKKPEGE